MASGQAKLIRVLLANPCQLEQPDIIFARRGVNILISVVLGSGAVTSVCVLKSGTPGYLVVAPDHTVHVVLACRSFPISASRLKVELEAFS